MDLFFSEKLEVVFKSYDLGFVVDQPSSEIPPSIGFLSLEYNGSLGLLIFLVTVKGKNKAVALGSVFQFLRHQLPGEMKLD